MANNLAATVTSESCATCVAGGFGAFILAIGDMLKAEDISTMTRIAQMFREQGMPGAEGLMLPIVLVVVLGIGVTWVHRPSLRTDGFVRGLSVFALLGAVSPELPPQDTLHDNHEGHGTSLRQDATLSTSFTAFALAGPSLTSEQPFSAAINILGLPSGTPVYVTMRSARSRRVVGRETVTTSRILIEKESGNYSIELEAEGYQRIKFDLRLREDGAYSVRLQPSQIPLALQRLRAPRKVTLAQAGPTAPSPHEL